MFIWDMVVCFMVRDFLMFFCELDWSYWIMKCKFLGFVVCNVDFVFFFCGCCLIVLFFLMVGFVVMDVWYLVNGVVV